MKRITQMIWVILLLTLFALPASAQTILRDGLEVTLTMDQGEYGALEVIDARLTIRNHNPFEVANVSAQIIPPKGFVLEEDGELMLTSLGAGEQTFLQRSFRDPDAPLPVMPDTGEHANILLWIALTAASLAALLALMRQSRRCAALILCMALLLPAFPGNARAESFTKRIVITLPVTIGGEKVEITASVCYEYDMPQGAFLCGDFICMAEGSGVKILDYTGLSNTVSIPWTLGGRAVRAIAPDAFGGHNVIRLRVWEGSAAEAFAKEHGIPFTYLREAEPQIEPTPEPELPPLDLGKMITFPDLVNLNLTEGVTITASGLPELGEGQGVYVYADCSFALTTQDGSAAVPFVLRVGEEIVEEDEPAVIFTQDGSAVVYIDLMMPRHMEEGVYNGSIEFRTETVLDPENHTDTPSDKDNG